MSSVTMSQLTLDLPESLLRQLAKQAERAGISLQHYVVYSLTRVLMAVDLERQKATFEELLSRYPEDQTEAALQDLLSRRQPPS
jgi:predicted HicB family RNase H-like nuclease